MALFGNKYRRPDDASGKFQRPEDGRSSAAKRRPSKRAASKDTPGDGGSRRLRRLGGTRHDGPNLFTDANLPAEWLMGSAVPLLVHKDNKKAENETAHAPP